MPPQVPARLSRPVAAITGASSGIGAAFARKLAPGHDFILIARRRDRLEQLSRELSAEYGSQAELLQADLSKETDLAKVAATLEATEHLAVLVNNAGFGSTGLFWEATLESQERMHQLHVMATMRLSYGALRNMVARDSGAVINVSSVAAFVRAAGSASYCATKTWMAVFSEALHLELLGVGSKVYVQALCPGYTYSEFHDTLGVDREKLAPSWLWMTAEQVVDASLRGFRQRKFLVVPGWHYGLMTSVLSKLPAGWRMSLASARTRKHPSSAVRG
jgi:short-subunit dehydrogenase